MLLLLLMMMMMMMMMIVMTIDYYHYPSSTTRVISPNVPSPLSHHRHPHLQNCHWKSLLLLILPHTMHNEANGELLDLHGYDGLKVMVGERGEGNGRGAR